MTKLAVCVLIALVISHLAFSEAVSEEKGSILQRLLVLLGARENKEETPRQNNGNVAENSSNDNMPNRTRGRWRDYYRAWLNGTREHIPVTPWTQPDWRESIGKMRQKLSRIPRPANYAPRSNFLLVSNEESNETDVKRGVAQELDSIKDELNDLLKRIDGFDHASESTFSKETKRNKRELLDISTILNPNVDYLIPKTWAVDPNATIGEEYESFFGYKLRPGQASDTESCGSIREVPAEFRMAKGWRGGVFEDFYQKYTEAWGIPIVGSSHVTDEGLKRACYEVVFVFAGRYDERNMYYKIWGRVALIADDEKQDDLPDYANVGYNVSDVRGLGGTLLIPTTSAGDDNVRCAPTERYYNQGIFLHEVGHTKHTELASRTIHGLYRAIDHSYQTAIAEGKYEETYMGRNRLEYSAVAIQVALEEGQLHVTENGTNFRINNRDNLEEYDSAIVNAINLMLPCNNQYVDRCAWQNCDIQDYSLVAENENVYWTASPSDQCQRITADYTISDVGLCASFACRGEKDGIKGNVFTHRNSYCFVYNCDITEENKLKTYVIDGYSVYKLEREIKQDLTLETSVPLNILCANKVSKNAADESRCAGNDRALCGPNAEATSARACNARGCCYKKDTRKCIYPNQECADKKLHCHLWAASPFHECERNPYFMAKNCMLSCGWCELYEGRIDYDKIDGECVDKRGRDCVSEANEGDCIYPQVLADCPLSCYACTDEQLSRLYSPDPLYHVQYARFMT